MDFSPLHGVPLATIATELLWALVTINEEICFRVLPQEQKITPSSGFTSPQFQQETCTCAISSSLPGFHLKRSAKKVRTECAGGEGVLRADSVPKVVSKKSYCSEALLSGKCQPDKTQAYVIGTKSLNLGCIYWVFQSFKKILISYIVTIIFAIIFATTV